MASRYVDTAARIAAMGAALAKHLDQPGSLHDGRKRHAAYIIEDVEPFDAVNLDALAYRNEEYRRAVIYVEAQGMTLPSEGVLGGLF